MTRSFLIAFFQGKMGILAIFCALLLAFPGLSLHAQPAQLTLADLLIGLRSKKATLEDRNSILTEAVSVRGVTFTLTPEIEKELTATGAGRGLIDSIRKKAQIVKAAMTSSSLPDAAVKPEVKPPPPDFSFYERRASSSAAKGEIDQAIADYTKAIEMNPSGTNAFLGRGAAHLAKKLWDLAIADYSKVLEMSPNNATAFAGRADAYEKRGDLEHASQDVNKLIEIEPDNQAAKSNAARLQTELNRLAELAKPQPVPATVSKPAAPEFLNVGALTEANATHMPKPNYPQIAYKAHIGGKVTVEVELNEEGSVTSANAVDGHVLMRRECEAAARASKFKPALYDGKPIKAKGTIVYNFVNTARN
ncbi:MAG: TonB family protein [Pyrinomonadaceae bacterium]